MSSAAKKPVARPFVLGRKKFAAITAVEGLHLTREGEERLETTEALTFEQRRAEVIRAHTHKRS